MTERLHRFTEYDGRLWLALETSRGWRCGKCKRGKFIPEYPGEQPHCRVCGCEQWIGRTYEVVSP